MSITYSCTVAIVGWHLYSHFCYFFPVQLNEIPCDISTHGVAFSNGVNHIIGVGESDFRRVQCVIKIPVTQRTKKVKLEQRTKVL